MNKQSLIIAREMIINVLSNMQKGIMPTEDQIELMRNLNLLLSPENYEEHIDVLIKHEQDKKLKKSIDLFIKI